MKKVLLCCWLILLNGCAGFATQNHADIGYINFKPKKLSLSYNVKVFRYLNDEPADYQISEAENYFSDMLGKNLSAPMYFISIDTDNPKADYVLEIHITDKGIYNKKLDILSLATLTIIPSVTHDKFFYEAKLINRKTKKVKQFNYSETYSKITHISMLLLMPFKSNEIDHMHRRIMNRMSYDIIRYIENGR